MAGNKIAKGSSPRWIGLDSFCLIDLPVCLQPILRGVKNAVGNIVLDHDSLKLPGPSEETKDDGLLLHRAPMLKNGLLRCTPALIETVKNVPVGEYLCKLLPHSRFLPCSCDFVFALSACRTSKNPPEWLRSRRNQRDFIGRRCDCTLLKNRGSLYDQRETPLHSGGTRASAPGHRQPTEDRNECRPRGNILETREISG